MRLKHWVLVLAIIGVCMVAGLYFARAIGPKDEGQGRGAAGDDGGRALASAPAASAPKEPGLLLGLALGRVEGDLVPDGTGEGYDARLRGSAVIGMGWGGRPALTFDGTGSGDFWQGQAQNCGLRIEKRMGRAFKEMTVEAWVRKEPAGWMPVIYRDKWDEESGFGLYTEWSAGKVAFGHYGGTSGVQSTQVVQDGRWHYVVGTMMPTADGNYCYRIYVDGELGGEQTGPWAVAEAPAEGGVLMIAYPNASGADVPYKGDLAGVGLFDVAMTGERIKARYEAQRPAEGR